MIVAARADIRSPDRARPAKIERVSEAVLIRTMEPGEFDAVRELSIAAFGGDPQIGPLLDALRESWAWDDDLSFVADRDGELGFVAPSARIPPAAFMVYKLANYETWMTGGLVYPDAFWRADAVGLRD